MGLEVGFAVKVEASPPCGQLAGHVGTFSNNNWHFSEETTIPFQHAFQRVQPLFLLLLWPPTK